MNSLLRYVLITVTASVVSTDPTFDFNYPNIKDDIYEQPINLMNSKVPHVKGDQNDAQAQPEQDPWTPYDFSKFDEYLSEFRGGESQDHNRIKRRAKRRRTYDRRSRGRGHVTPTPNDNSAHNSTTAEPSKNEVWSLDARRSSSKKKKKSKKLRTKTKPKFDTYEPLTKDIESSFIEMPKDLYQAHLRPGVIFRIHMSEAILKMQYRNYGEDKDESVIEADVEYLRLTRKVISDELTKFEDLQWLTSWFINRTDLIKEHYCNNRYFTVGIPPTMFTHSEEYMKRMCLFDSVFLDHIPYIIGEDGSLMAAVAPPVLHCDAATCTTVPFIDSIMFDERLPRTNVRTVTRCQASCRAHCRNDPDCLKRCSDRCLRAE